MRMSKKLEEYLNSERYQNFLRNYKEGPKRPDCEVLTQCPECGCHEWSKLDEPTIECSQCGNEIEIPKDLRLRLRSRNLVDTKNRIICYFRLHILLMVIVSLVIFITEFFSKYETIKVSLMLWTYNIVFIVIDFLVRYVKRRVKIKKLNALDIY